MLTALLASGCVSSREAGRADAKRDLAKGILAMETSGLGGRYNKEYFHLLGQRYDIRVSELGCLVDERTLKRAEGYNEIMVAEMERRFGTNFWRQAMADAKEDYESKHREAKTEE
jgi:hypothetical protein